MIISTSKKFCLTILAFKKWRVGAERSEPLDQSSDGLEQSLMWRHVDSQRWRGSAFG